jgi:hypothetical protein
MEHVHYLSETIGPRGSTRPGEIEAAAYAFRILRRAGLGPQTQGFPSARSMYYPFVLFAGIVLTGTLAFWGGGRWGAAAAAVLTLAALVSVLQELAFRPNLLRWILPKGQGTNVWTRIEPEQEAEENVVLIGHLDTHRTPLLFSEKWVGLLDRMVPVAIAATLLLVGLYIAQIFLGLPFLNLAAIPMAALILGLFLLMLQADFTPFTAGANDNATGAGVVLDLAGELKTRPLAKTRVWILLSGCEEVGCYGAEAFARTFKQELGRPVWLSIDSVGGVGAGVAYLTSETFLLTTHSNPELLKLADDIARRNPPLNAYAHAFRGAYTEGAIGGKYGFRVLSFVSYRRDGILPEWHRKTDTVENIDPRVAENTARFLQMLLQRIDGQSVQRA